IAVCRVVRDDLFEPCIAVSDVHLPEGSEMQVRQEGVERDPRTLVCAGERQEGRVALTAGVEQAPRQGAVATGETVTGLRSGWLSHLAIFSDRSPRQARGRVGPV